MFSLLIKVLGDEELIVISLRILGKHETEINKHTVYWDCKYLVWLLDDHYIFWWMDDHTIKHH